VIFGYTEEQLALFPDLGRGRLHLVHGVHHPAAGASVQGRQVRHLCDFLGLGVGFVGYLAKSSSSGG
jgi:hypothetical protein